MLLLLLTTACSRFIIITDSVFQDYLLSTPESGTLMEGGTWMACDLMRALGIGLALYECYYPVLVFAWLELAS